MIKKIMFTSCILLITGCANSSLYSGDVYTTTQAKTVRSVSYGTLTSVRSVYVQDTDQSGRVGSTVGTILGAASGSAVGSGSGQYAAIAVGAALGGLVGNQAGQAVGKNKALELEIKKDDGRSIVVVQTLGESQFYPGQRVRLVGSGNSINVAPAQ